MRKPPKTEQERGERGLSREAGETATTQENNHWNFLEGDREMVLHTSMRVEVEILEKRIS